MSVVERAARTYWSTTLTVVVLSAIAVAVGVYLRLSVGGAVGLYFVVWWTVLFVVLPVHIRTQADDDEVLIGSDPGAPSSPALRQRAVWTTLVSAVVFAAVAAFFPLAGL